MSSCEGTNINTGVTPGEKYCRAKTRTFAISSRWTQGVTGCSPSTRRGRRALERFERGSLLFPDREREVELRARRFETRPEAVCFFYSTGTRVEFRIVERGGERADLRLELRDLALYTLGALSGLT